MNDAESQPKAEKKSKIEKIEEIYGKDTASATLKETSEFLKKKGFPSLADLLVPSK